MSRRAELQETVWRSDPHTSLKHLVYRHYVGCWMGKILQTFPHAAIIDAYAGPGVYSDGPDGSPVLFAKSYLQHKSRQRFGSLTLVTAEERPDRQAHLMDLLRPLRTDERLDIQVPQQGRFLDLLPRLDRLARTGRPGSPVLWVVDPFAKDPLPMAALRRCLQGPRDELLLTFFVDEHYRWGGTTNYQRVLDEHYGDDSWRPARREGSEAAAKQAYASLFCAALEKVPSVKARAFGIAVKNQTPRYHIVYATKSESGLRCWNPTTWKLDKYGGRQTTKAQASGQTDIFDLDGAGADLSGLRGAVQRHSGLARSWIDLEREATHLGYQAKHLRSVLDELAGDGLAIRLQPLDADARSPWPGDSVIQLYSTQDVDAG